MYDNYPQTGVVRVTWHILFSFN